ncbi:MAG: aldehyde dehydrogenase family protein [Nannocystaceae bacterium]|nr:aldehyde dehydrogenase family protein [Myxococcales bacterium]
MSSPAEIAATARARSLGLLEQLALQTDAIADRLASGLGLVAWDRERVIGGVQRALWALHDGPRPELVGGRARVIERAAQPLESLPLVWEQLLRGRVVSLSLEPSASAAVRELLASEVAAFAGALILDPLEGSGDPLVGVRPARSRVAIVLDDTDRELAAYILARVALRRSGADPRAVKRVFVSGGAAHLLRHLERLWVGAIAGPPDDADAFMGPVDADAAGKHLAALDGWAASPGVRVICPGGQLHRGGDRRRYLAPALLEVAWPVADPALALDPDEWWPGPALFVHALASAAAIDVALSEADIPVERRLVIGPRRRRTRGADDERPRTQGALMIERVPPGLPPPRPV